MVVRKLQSLEAGVIITWTCAPAFIKVKQRRCFIAAIPPEIPSSTFFRLKLTLYFYLVESL
jgi:hypothetical protein